MKTVILDETCMRHSSGNKHIPELQKNCLLYHTEISIMNHTITVAVIDDSWIKKMSSLLSFLHPDPVFTSCLINLVIVKCQ